MQKKPLVISGCSLTKLSNITVDDIDAKKSARYIWVLVVTELFYIGVNNFNAKKSAHYSRLLIVTQLVVSGAKCTSRASYL